MADQSSGTTSGIGFPAKCDYEGGIAALGKHGKHLWIEDGRIGHGELKLTHGISLSDVSGVEILERAEEPAPNRCWPKASTEPAEAQQ
jgi:hypothetical protein